MIRLLKKLLCLMNGHPLRYVRDTGFCCGVWECRRCGRQVETSFLNDSPMRVIRVIKP